MTTGVEQGMRLAQQGLLLNAALAAVKFVAGVVGNSYALIADAVESGSDVFASVIVWSGLRVAAREADDDYPFGYGKAEALAAAAVALLLLAAALGIAVEAVREIRAPHHAPAPFTLAVLVGVVLVKEGLFRRTRRGADATGSTAVRADAWHHRSDAITSAAAFIGISAALLGGPGWESADDWAALVAATIIAWNGIAILRQGVDELMDKSPPPDLLARVAHAAHGVPGVLATEKLMVRKVGTRYWVDLHVQAEPTLPLHDAHVLSGCVKSAIRAAIPEVAGALIHMEPYEGAPAPAPRA
ncbi:MAG: cation diffusion facilitator family transporter [Gemmatimonadales bacterium]|nr:cation diffusion facilitator family transporter [Gemmatimonadales bacterium]